MHLFWEANVNHSLFWPFCVVVEHTSHDTLLYAQNITGIAGEVKGEKPMLLEDLNEIMTQVLYFQSFRDDKRIVNFYGLHPVQDRHWRPCGSIC
jgi:hypothetical protein